MRLFRCQHFHTTVRAPGVINIDHFPHYIPSLAERCYHFFIQPFFFFNIPLTRSAIAFSLGSPFSVILYTTFNAL